MSITHRPVLRQSFVGEPAGQALPIEVTISPAEDLTDVALELRLKTGTEATIVLDTFDAAQADDGIVVFTLSASQTENAAGKRYQFQLWDTDAEQCLSTGDILFVESL